MKIPMEGHYAIVTPKRVYIDSPSYGSDYTDSYDYEVYTDKSEWLAQIDYYTRNNKEFRAIHATVARTEVKVEISIDAN